MQVGRSNSLTAANSLLGIESQVVGPRSRFTLREYETELLDDIAPYFDAEADAIAAKERLAARGTKTVLVALAGCCWTLVRMDDHAFADRAAAEAASRAAAARGRPMTVKEHEGGFVLVPAQMAA